MTTDPTQPTAAVKIGKRYYRVNDPVQPSTQISHRDDLGGVHILLIWPSRRTISAYLDPISAQEWESHLATKESTDAR